jgi:hypothetical protein
VIEKRLKEKKKKKPSGRQNTNASSSGRRGDIYNELYASIF